MEITKIYSTIKLYEGNIVKLLNNLYHVEDCNGKYYELSPVPNDYNFFEVLLNTDNTEIVCTKYVEV